MSSPTVLEPTSLAETEIVDLAPVEVILPARPRSDAAAARRSFMLVFTCTLIGAAAQILMKQGSSQVGAHASLSDVAKHPAMIVGFALGVVTNIRLFAGYCLYGVNTFLMAAALKGRELSRLYPIIALTYVWVTILSLFMLNGEHLNGFRLLGITFIVGGVSVLGMRK